MREDQKNTSKVFAAIYPHSDDFTIFSAGLMLQLLNKGYTGYFIRVTNDEKDSYDLSIGETIYKIEKETHQIADYLGISEVYDLNYKNHYMQHSDLVEIRHRLITIFRHLQVDAVISFDPWGHYEENNDHYLTGMAVEQACWMAGRPLDLPELNQMGLKPHFVTEKYYVARGPQLTNLECDVTDVIDKKYTAITMNETPVDNMYRVYLDKCVETGKSPVDQIKFVRENFIDTSKDTSGRYIEKYHYIAPTDY